MTDQTPSVKQENQSIDGVPVWGFDKLDVKNPVPGLYFAVPMEIYHDSINALGSSAIRAACRSMLDYKRVLAKREAFATSEALEFGRAFALLCEVPDAIDKIIFESCAKGFDTIKVQAERTENPDNIYVKPGSFAMLTAMSDAYKNHPIAKNYVDAEWKELTVIWKCQHTGALCKARPDKYVNGELIDDKTMRSDFFNLNKIKWTISDPKLRYDVQSTFYFDGLRAVGVKCERANICFVQKEEILPDVAVYGVNPDEQAEARQAYVEAIRAIQQSEVDGIYPGIAPEIICDLFGFDEPEKTFE